MARYKHIDTSPRLLPVDLGQQLLPGTFEHALNHLLDHEIDLSCFDARFCNDETGATAYPPAMLLKVVLFAYSRGIVSSRSIERACREQVTFIALCGDSGPHSRNQRQLIVTVDRLEEFECSTLIHAKPPWGVWGVRGVNSLS